MSNVETLPFFGVVPAPPSDNASVVTLGPAGTSSEQAAAHFAAIRGSVAATIHLTSTYEEAVDRTLADPAAFAVVANAYAGINVFYMNPRLVIDTVFYFSTPSYGLAARSALSAGGYSVASHPAPVPLIEELSPYGFTCNEIIYMSSTSGAAELVAQEKIDVALTTEVAAARHGLTFVSQVRPIPMVWTAFRRETGGPA